MSTARPPEGPSLAGRREFLRGLAASAAAAGGACRRGVSACRMPAPNPFLDHGRPLLVAVEGEDVVAMLRAGLERLGGVGPLLAAGRDAMLRGNYCAAQPYPVTTAGETVVAVADELRRAGFARTKLFEAHGTRLLASLAPDTAVRKLGVLELAARSGIGVQMCDPLESREFRLVRNPAWSVSEPVAVHRALHEAGVVISLPVLKRHQEARITCALKMHFGSVALTDRYVAHAMERRGSRGYLETRLVHFADAVRPQLNVVDARCLLTRGGPTLSNGGEVRRHVNRLVLCGDMVATDAYCARLMARHDPTFSPETIDAQLKHAVALGLGTADLDAVRIVELRA
jgi:uncharacterized protein (DUF362 family)